MGVSQTMAVEIVRDGWWRRTRARFRPSQPIYHASRTLRVTNARPGSGGRHRHTTGGVIVTYRIAAGRYVSFRRHT